MGLATATECNDFSSISQYGCLAGDAMLLSKACMDKVAEVIGLETADVEASVSAWTTIHTACLAVTDSVCCFHRLRVH